VRALLARADLEHAARALLRHARLVAAEPSRARSHAPGAFARHLLLLVRELARGRTGIPRPSRLVAAELEQLHDGLRRASSGNGPFGIALDEAALAAFLGVWTQAAPGSGVPAGGSSFAGVTLRA
jgi:hypothetical protein